MTTRFFVVLTSMILSLVPVESLAQSSISVLNAQLQQAVAARSWEQAIQLIDRMTVAAPQQAAQLKQYRVQLQQLQRSSVNLPLNLKTATPRPEASDFLGRVPIKRRQAGTAIIDVTFNQRRNFEMLVDSGASLTVITRSMAAALGLTASHVVDEVVFATANGKTKLPIVYINSIKVGGLSSSQIPVAVAGSDMTMGLLGQDFLQQFDFTFRKNVIEFHKRQS